MALKIFLYGAAIKLFYDSRGKVGESLSRFGIICISILYITFLFKK